MPCKREQATRRRRREISMSPRRLDAQRRPGRASQDSVSPKWSCRHTARRPRTRTRSGEAQAPPAARQKRASRADTARAPRRQIASPWSEPAHSHYRKARRGCRTTHPPRTEQRLDPFGKRGAGVCADAGARFSKLARQRLRSTPCLRGGSIADAEAWGASASRAHAWQYAP